jgi:membrane associated rhomboid family serine protease
VSQPDLFVVCKNCGSEVSPYVTECPYCGQRVRKRAPKLEREGEDQEPRQKRARRPRLPRLRPDEIQGVAPDTRPVATLAIIALSLLVTLALATQELGFDEVGGIVKGIEADEPWRWVTAPFVHDSLGYQFVTLTAVGVFGSMIERRFGAFPLLALFLLCGTAGSAAAVGADTGPLLEDTPLYLILGANGAALGLLSAWLVDDRRAHRRGDDRGTDLLGVYVLGAVLLLMPLAVLEANPVAGVAGAAAGAILGLALPLLGRR